MHKFGISLMAAGLACLIPPAVSQADQVILDDLIVDGSACIGQDCVNGESFGFDTLRLKENNLRIKAQDTSNSGSFPSNDWQITFNDSANGGANKFSIDDIDGGRTPFTIEASAPSHSLYVDDGGRIGFGTSTPVVNLHVKEGNTPTLRLEQDGSSGFTPQTWDVAGNEANFFVRDATNGSKLPFKIKPSAPTGSIFIAADGDVGMGTESPDAELEVEQAGPTRLRLNNTTQSAWDINSGGGGSLRFSDAQDTDVELILDGSGNLTITGTLMVNNDTTCTTPANCVPDYVFKEDYNLMPLTDLATFVQQEKHLPNIPSAIEVKKTGRLNMTEMQLKLLEKVEELTLYTLEQEKTINELQERLAALE